MVLLTACLSAAAIAGLQLPQPSRDLSFDLSRLGRLVEHRATGFLSGVGETPTSSGAGYVFSVPDKYITPLKPFGWRDAGMGHPAAFFPRLRQLGVQDIQILLAPGACAGMGTGGCPGINMCAPKTCGDRAHPGPSACSDGDCTGWADLVHFVVQNTLHLPAPLSFDVWNEMMELNQTQLPQQYFDIWLTAHRIVKGTRPEVKLIGPSLNSPLQYVH